MSNCPARVHKEHHESYNPDPFSGLSMHWAESTIYFSSALLISPIVPLWVFRLLSLGLLVSFAVAKLFGINIAFEDCCFNESLILMRALLPS